MQRVSVIIPTYNRSADVVRAVHSVLNQTIPVEEILVCDDGSDDDTERNIGMIPDRRIKFIQGDHSGRPAIPRNRGLKACTGEWIAFLDSDDEWLSAKLELQLSALKVNSVKACCTNAWKIQDKMKEVFFHQSGDQVYTFKDLLDVNRVICSSMIFHKSLLDNIHGFPEEPELKALEDYALWFRIASYTDILYCSEPLLIYPDQPADSVRKDPLNYWKQRKTVLRNFLSWSGKKKLSPEIHALAVKAYRKAQVNDFKSAIKQFWSST